MKKAFVSIVSSYVGYCIASVLRRQGYDVVGSIRAEDTEDISSLVAQTVDAGDEAGTVQLALLADVVVLCLLEDVRGADAVLSALQMPQQGNEFSRPSHLLVLSTTMTWAKTKQTAAGNTASSEMPASSSSRSLSRPVSMMAMDRRLAQGAGAGAGAGAGGGGGTGGGGLPRTSSAMSRSTPSRDGSRPLGTASSKNSARAISHASGLSRRRFQGAATQEPAMTEADYLLRQPPTGYLEHKRLETVALQLESSSLTTCVVGAGVPYGLGEGPLLRLFREAWRARGSPVAMPTCSSGDNHPGLVHVVDLSVAVGNLLQPVEPGAPPPRFPRPYVLAVEGNGAQCTARELTAAIGRGFGGGGKTQPMGEAELEEMLVEDPAALSLLTNVRFSNDGGVLAGMVADGTLEPVTWSRGFAASATAMAREFVCSRSLQSIKAVVLGPPGGHQSHVCKQISRRYGLLHVDTKIAVDGVFEALGKPLPSAVSAEEKAPPPAKGKKAKDTKKAPAKAEPPPDAQAALAALPPTERLLADVQAAFEAADVPMSDYTNLDAAGLAGLLPPSVVARSARLFLEENITRWACSGYILCDIPSHGDAALEIFEDPPPQTPPKIPRAIAATTNAGAGDSPKSRGGAGEGLESSSNPPTARNPAGAGGGAAAGVAAAPPPPATDAVAERFRPTRVVYLDASLEHIVEQQGRRAGAGAGEAAGAGVKEAEAKLRARLERYFAREQQQAEPLEGTDSTSADIAPPGEKRRPSNSNGSNGPGSKNQTAAPGEEEPVGEHGNGDRCQDEGRWIPATARSLQDRYAIDVRVIDAEDGGGGEEGGPSDAVVTAVDEHVCGGEVPGFVSMLSEGDDGFDATAEEAGKSSAEEKRLRQENSGDGGGGGGDGGFGEGCEPAAYGGGDLDAWAVDPTDNGGRDDNATNSKPGADDDSAPSNNLSLTEVLAKLTARDAREVEQRTRKHRSFLTDGVVPQVAAGLVAAAEAQPDNIFEFLAEYLISAGKELQSKAEKEAAEKYQAGLALLQELEANDKKRAAAA